ncbi:MAG: FtsQ-type POTRA domain-containing protein [Gammaproteobacteria bacterium]|nr:FtsQ-type POTRA domain-containing protein [Gammaproteobacteria bacterium]MDH5800075.1 FtsQ-type POTRA domain-containing protein [Gammaproteobacteria bacterium]
MVLRYTWYLGIGIVVTAVILNWTAATKDWVPVFWPVTKIKIVGDVSHVGEKTLEQTVGEYLNNGFFTTDVESLQESVQGLAWVESASVRRLWPDTIQINVEERQAVASWNGQYLISNHGELFESEDMLEGAVVQIRGPEGMHRYMLDQCQDLQVQFGKHGLELTHLTLNERRALEMRLANGVKFVFGRVHGINESGSVISKFLLAYQHGLKAKMDRIRTVDMRYTNGFSVRWRKEQRNNNQNHSISG